MIIHIPKAVVEDVNVDWSEWCVLNDKIVYSSWSGSEQLNIHSTAFDDQLTSAYISAETPGEYFLTNKVYSAFGWPGECTLCIVVKQ